MQAFSFAEADYFQGVRYIRFDENFGGLDPAVMPLYDINGFIAGIQGAVSSTFRSSQGFEPESISAGPSLENLWEPQTLLFTLIRLSRPPLGSDVLDQVVPLTPISA